MALDASRRVLLVDDDFAARKLYRAHLAAAGYEVYEVATGIEAVWKIDEEAQIDVVVIDVNAPALEGWVAFSLIQARHPKMPVVILTAPPTDDRQDVARISRPTDVLNKPCRPDALVAAVGRVVAGSHPPTLAA